MRVKPTVFDGPEAVGPARAAVAAGAVTAGAPAVACAAVSLPGVAVGVAGPGSPAGSGVRAKSRLRAYSSSGMTPVCGAAGMGARRCAPPGPGGAGRVPHAPPPPASRL